LLSWIPDSTVLTALTMRNLATVRVLGGAPRGHLHARQMFFPGRPRRGRAKVFAE
jgi:hypothetical protein